MIPAFISDGLIWSGRWARPLACAASAAWLSVLGAATTASAVTLEPLRLDGGELVPAAVFGKDDRTRLPERLQGLRSAIGLIYNSQARTVCSAFCVADNIVATASHCIYRTKGETPPPADRFVFSRPGTRHGEVRIAGAGKGAAAQQILAGATGISTKPPIDAARDWALVRIDEPACRGHALPLRPASHQEIEREAAADRLFQVAFHRDFGNWSITYSRSCSAGPALDAAAGAGVERDFSDPGNLVLHTCDTGGASSGSPLLVMGSRGPEVVAMNVGTFVRSRAVLRDGEMVRRLPPSAVANTAVAVHAFASRLALLQSASILTSASDLRALQGSLLALRIYHGPLDGRFGAKLRGAIHEYEVREGNTPTGLPTGALLQRLEQVAPFRPGQHPRADDASASVSSAASRPVSRVPRDGPPPRR